MTMLVYDKVYDSDGKLIKNVYQDKMSKKSFGGVFSNRMMTAGISRKVFGIKKKKAFPRTK